MGSNTNRLRKLVLVTIILTAMVIVMGAYTRLTDAGLGCPDWPGCYGHLVVPKHPEKIEAAQQAFPERAFESHKAWNEMIHRYLAGTLGIFILAIFLLSIKNHAPHRPFKLPMFLLALVLFQAALGMWTVTMKLMPIVVMGHLIGGFSTIALLTLLFLRLTPYRIPGGDAQLRPLYTLSIIGLVILIIQIMLGGWTSANYAAMVCTQLPICEGQWYQNLNFVDAFNPISPHNEHYEFGVLGYAERMTIHVTHRLWAIVTFIYLLWLALKIHKTAMSNMFKTASRVLIMVLVLQVSLGIANIWFSLPLGVAVAHNAVAAGLMLCMVFICYSIYRKA